MFYDKEIELLIEGEGYTDEYGIWNEGEEVPFKTVECDVQPYSSELLYKDYGYKERVKKRIFCDDDGAIINGMAVLYKGVRYVVKLIIPWDDYLEVMIDDI